MRQLAAPLVVLALLAACGGSEAGTDNETTTEAATPATAPSETDAAPPTTEATTTESPALDETTRPESTVASTTTEPEPTLPDAAPWDGPRFDEAIEPTMAALAVGVGQPISAAAVAPEIVLPEAVPTPGGTITGAGWVSSFDPRRNEHELDHAVGLDSTITPDELRTWQEGVGGGWRAPSFAESGSIYTSLLIDEQDQRLIHVLDTEAPDIGRPPLNLTWAPNVTSLLEPDWLAALPRPEGGVPTEVSAARGDVTVGLGGTGFDGSVFVRFDYALDDFDRMVEYFEDGTLVGAGFEYEPEPLSNARYRRDVALGDWSGRVMIGEASSNDVEYLQVIWQLTRGAP